jgi:AraC family transcriptional regulator of adaptative response / DNA-3-methyladenine glycosylase II
VRDISSTSLPIPERFASVLGRDALLRPALERHQGLRVPAAWDPFELGVRAILGQQVSVQAATTLSGRLVRAFGEPLAEPDGALTHLFPLSDRLAEADLTRIGLPRARANAVRTLAGAVAGGNLDLSPTADSEDVRRRLEALPGVGPWTAQYVAMRALRDPDAFPSDDLAVRHALGATAAETLARAAVWRPWRAYAVMHVWAGLEQAAPLEAAA